MTTPGKKTTTKSKSRKKATKEGFFARNRLAVIIVSSILIAMMVGVAVFALPSYKGAKTSLIIPAGSSSKAIADSLETRLGATMGKRVYMLWKLQGGTPAVAHGYYVVEPGCSAARISRNIARGAQTPVTVSFNAVRTLEKLAVTVTKNMEMTPDDFLHACSVVLADSGFVETQFPAAFIPDTYEFYYTTSPESFVARLLGYRNRYWTEERISKARSMGLSPVEVATIASIVEEETAKIDERPTVARLYMNRLAKGMKLQADPTVKFAIGDETIRRISGNMLKTDSPYNTYLYDGLPPGPIRIPERSTMEAVLNAPVNDYLYMCAREDFSGYHNFTSSYDVHRQNAARYQAELNRRGIK